MAESDCLEKLKQYFPEMVVFQEFNSNPNTKSSEIEECFDVIPMSDAIRAGYAFDYILFYLANQADDQTLDMITTLSDLTDMKSTLSTTYSSYMVPILDLIKTQPKLPTKLKSLYPDGVSGVRQFLDGLKKSTVFIKGYGSISIDASILAILYFQICLLMWLFSRKFPKLYIKNISNASSLIFGLVTLFNVSSGWDSLNSILSQKSSGFTAFHPLMNQEELTVVQPLDRIAEAKNYIKLIGLYLSYQLHKSDDLKEKALGKPNQPYYPTNIKPNDLNVPEVVDTEKPVIVNLKTPFSIGKDLNTFAMPQNQMEISVITLNQLPGDSQYEPVGNYLTLDEITSYMKDETFLMDLTKSELKLMAYKYDTYVKMRDEIMNNLAQAGIEPKLMASLQKKLAVIEIVVGMTKTRIDTVQKLSAEKQIKRKSDQLSNIMNDKDNGILSIKGSARENVRRYLYSQIYIFSKAPELYYKNFANFTLMGSAGAGKTKIAGVLGYTYGHLGVLAGEGKFLIVTRADLVAGYIGHTAPKTRDYLSKILEGVLLIDEAYQLSTCPNEKGEFMSSDFGAEAITELVNYIDKHIGLSVIIAAGYEKKITTCFLAINEGMSRRFPNNIRLLPYSALDLWELLDTFIREKIGSNPLSVPQQEYIKLMIKTLNDPETKFNGDNLFINQAGDMLNLATQILEDYLMGKDEGYNLSAINMSFQKFFANKGIYIEFNDEKQSGGAPQITYNIINQLDDADQDPKVENTNTDAETQQYELTWDHSVDPNLDTLTTETNEEVIADSQSATHDFSAQQDWDDGHDKWGQSGATTEEPDISDNFSAGEPMMIGGDPVQTYQMLNHLTNEF